MAIERTRSVKKRVATGQVDGNCTTFGRRIGPRESIPGNRPGNRPGCVKSGRFVVLMSLVDGWNGPEY